MEGWGVKQIEYKRLGKWGKHLSVVYIDIFIIYERKLWVTITNSKRYVADEDDDDDAVDDVDDNVCTQMV